MKSGGKIGIKLVISDDNEKPGAARKAVFGSLPCQKYQLRLQQNDGTDLSKKTIGLKIDVDSRSIFNTSNDTGYLEKRKLMVAVKNHALA